MKVVGKLCDGGRYHPTR